LLRQVRHILKPPVWLSQHQLPESSHSKEISRELVKKSLFEAVGQNNLSEFWPTVFDFSRSKCRIGYGSRVPLCAFRTHPEPYESVQNWPRNEPGNAVCLNCSFLFYFEVVSLILQTAVNPKMKLFCLFGTSEVRK
jgi:hypothetical protein